MGASRYRLRPTFRAAFGRRNLSQNELARRCDLTSRYLSQLLNGLRCPGPAVRRRLLENLPGMQFDDLFEEVE